MGETKSKSEKRLSTQLQRDIEATLLGQDQPHTHEAHVALLPQEAAFQRSAAVVRDVTEKRRPA